MRLFTELNARAGFVMGTCVPGAVCTAGGCKRAWVRLRLIMITALLAGMLSACGTPAKSRAGALKMPPKSRYILKVSELVDKQWHLYLKQRPNDAAFGGMEVGYWVNPKGKVVKMRVMGANRASPDLVRLTMDAIEEVDLPRMPADVVSKLTPKDEGVLKLIYKAYVPPSNGGRGCVQDARVQWNKEHVMNQVGYVPYTEAEKLTGLGKETPASRYSKLVLGRVKRQWSLYIMQSRVSSAGGVDVVFSVNSQGKVESPKANPQKDCDPRLTELTLRAVRDAEIPPMPTEVRSALAKNGGRINVIFHVDGR